MSELGDNETNQASHAATRHRVGRLDQDSCGPMLRHGKALIVFDGPRRLIWQRIGAARWRPRRLWPNPTETAEVLDTINQGDPVLIILDRHPQPVPVLADELAAAPAAVTDLAGALTGDVADLHIPTLTWLPHSWTRHGQRFLQHAAEQLTHRPALLMPPLLLHSADPPAATLWFGLRTHPRPWTAAELTALVEHLGTAQSTSRAAS
ncbi:hypothetical protein [Actinophytocola sp.]|uniref:hypothetical protein n=1 Tax=Actinophytocola sp. TaxID=1872138 RepID=UPI002D80EA34|nr:hypothetical protein [Actinophytocola sp.]HET9139275.1 hypothetical protein [Actinophytocola sp.]